MSVRANSRNTYRVVVLSNVQKVELSIDVKRLKPRFQNLLDSYMGGSPDALGKINQAMNECRLLFVILDDISAWLDWETPVTIHFDQIGAGMYVKDGYDSKCYYSVESIPTSQKTKYLMEIVEALDRLPEFLPITIWSDGTCIHTQVLDLRENKYRIYEAPMSVREIFRQVKDLEHWQPPKPDTGPSSRVRFLPDQGVVVVDGDRHDDDSGLRDDQKDDILKAFLALSIPDKKRCYRHEAFVNAWGRYMKIRCPKCTMKIVPRHGIFWGYYCPTCGHMIFF
jgi:hypothetical protein